MSRRLRSIVLGVAIGLAAGAAALAQPSIRPGGGGGTPQPQPTQGGLISAITPDATAKLLQAAGYAEVEIYKSQSGAQNVRAKIGQLPVYVVHTNCENNACSTLGFTIYFGKQETIDWNYINAWHASWRFARLYRNKEGELVFDMDLALLSGVSPEYIQRSAVLYATMLSNLLKFNPKQ